MGVGQGLGRYLGSLEAFWGCLGGPFGCCRGLLVGLGEGFGRHLRIHGAILVYLGASWASLGHSQRGFGVFFVLSLSLLFKLELL